MRQRAGRRNGRNGRAACGPGLAPGRRSSDLAGTPNPEATIPLTSKQRAHLKSLAHPLKPLVHVGKEGVTGTVLANLQEAFNTRELLKVKVLEGAPQGAKEIGEDLGWRLEGVDLVQVIGRTIVLYRRHPENPEIRLPG